MESSTTSSATGHGMSSTAASVAGDSPGLFATVSREVSPDLSSCTPPSLSALSTTQPALSPSSSQSYSPATSSAPPSASNAPAAAAPSSSPSASGGTAPASKCAEDYKGEDVDDKIDSTGCKCEYSLLEDCLFDHDKDWRKCQQELRVFRDCCAKERVGISLP
eukprot:GHVT01039366.1.p1 GENE.GHVT01039366.1~~GHVT01039366.1.p1  ORF type:complete len:163 (+),score=32.55 GHVT01039366.1:146-634(+)